MSTNICAVIGSTRDQAHTNVLVSAIAASAREHGAEVRILDLGEVVLPLLVAGSPSQHEDAGVRLVKELANWAHAFILGTPEYHGGPSGAIKNWFDHLYPELAGKLAGIVTATGGSDGAQAASQLEVNSRMCHMWTLPYLASAKGADFKNGELINDRARDRLMRMGRDLAVYGRIIATQFNADQHLGKGPDVGFAGWHQHHTE